MTDPRHRSPRRTKGSYGWRVARLAEGLGRPLLDWQRVACDLMDEHDRDGLRTNRLIVLTCPRRSGKTELLLLRQTDKALFGPPNQRLWITAQTGSMARERWREYTDWLKTTVLGPRLKVKAVTGAERVIFPNGSTIRPFSPTRESLHGMAADECALDEMWAIDPIRGQELLAAISPTLATRPGAQLVITSTQGTAESVWFHGFCERGRQGDPAITYLEWSAEGVAADDYAAIAAAHPAVGTLIDPAFIREQAAVMSDVPGEFLRAYANIPTRVQERTIPRDVWDRASTSEPLPAVPAVCFGADVALDRSRSAIVACTGGILEVVESREDVAWLAPRLRELRDRHKPAGICLDSVGPAATVHDELSRAGVPILPVTVKSYAAACQALLDGLRAGAVRHRKHPLLDAAADAAAERRIGDAWVWGRRRASGAIPELTAATHALYADQHRPAEPARPMVMAG